MQRHVIDALALMVRKVTVVIELADTKIDESPLDALALYIKALHIHHSISHYVKKAAQSHHHLAYSSRLGLGWLPSISRRPSSLLFFPSHIHAHTIGR